MFALSPVNVRLCEVTIELDVTVEVIEVGDVPYITVESEVTSVVQVTTAWLLDGDAATALITGGVDDGGGEITVAET